MVQLNVEDIILFRMVCDFVYHLRCKLIHDLEQTCQRCYRISKERQLWATALSDLILKNHLPPAVPPIRCRSADELEQVAVRYLRSRRRGARSMPDNTNLKVKDSPTGPNGWFLIPGGRWLLGPGPAEDNNLCCWDLSGESSVECMELAQPNPKKEEDFTYFQVEGSLYDDGGGATIAVVKQEMHVLPLL